MADLNAQHAAADHRHRALAVISGISISQVAAGDPDFVLCMEIRLAVFVGEQNVTLEEEQDGFDTDALHFLARAGDQPCGTARVLMKDEGAKITRVAVLRDFRGQGIGEALMRWAEAHVSVHRFFLDAQVHALPFYERLGYAPRGDVFIEAGIPHRPMVKNKRAAP